MTHIVLEENDHETINSISKFDCKLIIQQNKVTEMHSLKELDLLKLIFCIFNADGSFKPDELKYMMELSKIHNYDLVFGSRYEKKFK